MPNTTEWSNEEMQLLIDLRRERNKDYWRRFSRSNLPFWKEIMVQIEEEFGIAFTDLQASDKFKGMVRECKVNKILLKERTIRF